MQYCRLEMKKIVREKLFAVFIFLCLCLNIGLCFSHQSARETVNGMAKSGVSPEGEKIFDALDTTVLGTYYYHERYLDSSLLSRWMMEKYEKLQQAVNLLDAKDADLSPFAGEMTPLVHEALFVYQLKVLLLECVVFLSLLGLWLFWSKQQTEMAALIYSTRRGRKIAKDKLLAGGMVGALYCFVLIVISLAVFFAVWDFGELWDVNMASSFHYVVNSDEPVTGKPFITWTSFTLKKYFVCTLLLMMGILFAWWLLTNLTTLLVKSGGCGAVILAAMLCLPFFGLILLPGLHFSWLLYFDTWTLSVVIYCSQWWFTDLGNYALFAYQEVVTVTAHLLLLGFGLGAGIRYFKRKELI